MTVWPSRYHQPLDFIVVELQKMGRILVQGKLDVVPRNVEICKLRYSPFVLSTYATFDLVINAGDRLEEAGPG